jgi:5-methyltetrahydropteroyltriglutamate--homocysteine methyltransferase
MTIASNLGFPRIGRHRELKSALERFWSGDLDEAGLADAARALRSRHWKLQGGHGISHVPSGDFSLYDHVLDTACMVGAIRRHGWLDGPSRCPAILRLHAAHAERPRNMRPASHLACLRSK